MRKLHAQPVVGIDVEMIAISTAIMAKTSVSILPETLPPMTLPGRWLAMLLELGQCARGA
ncbi:hypothetical protein OF122_01605 [Pelagibacterium flavum]|uniref:Uncharacterized protein n=1 Tax=Pelagibacterium flavum TaxID=2984530 RepID=A0ABY6IPJ4_9HYPH|nr:hypothetical protein [Pelagibacterium sp. YIM 151497]MAN77439.1 hypothetical protein [Hyphomicrobiales bacterium]UYQ72514.1 hypothetical protein OF122_01605 [Pelagibacterium sp. YIM 151497]